MRKRDVDRRRIAVNDLSIAEAKRDAVSLEERARLPRPEHRIDRRTDLTIIGEVRNQVDDELVSSRRAVELPSIAQTTLRFRVMT